MVAMNPQGAQFLSQSWKLVPDVVEMLPVTLAGSRNAEIRLN